MPKNTLFKLDIKFTFNDAFERLDQLPNLKTRIKAESKRVRIFITIPQDLLIKRFIVFNEYFDTFKYRNKSNNVKVNI